MEVIKGRLIDDVYKKLIEKLLKSETIDNNTREIENCVLQVKEPRLYFFSFPYREISTKYTDAELKWYWSADNRCETIGQYAKMWLRLTDDGVTNNSAYGYILFKKYGFNQLEQVIELLKKDRNTRRAVLNISDPTIDRINTKDMQCTIALQFIVRDGKLNTTVYMRSNDVYFGLPYDYIFFISLATYIATRLELKVGTYTHVATSMHMYERDVNKFIEHNQTLDINLGPIIKENYDGLAK